MILFKENAEIEVTPVVVSRAQRFAQRPFVVIFYWITWYSNDVTTQKVKAIKKKPEQISLLQDLVHESVQY